MNKEKIKQARKELKPLLDKLKSKYKSKVRCFRDDF
jgi:hypothetical protein